MQSFYINLAHLFTNPYSLSKKLIEKDAKNLNFTFLLIFLTAICQYIGYTLTFGTTNSLFSYIIFMLLYSSLFFLFLFLDSSIINHFLKNNNNYKFQPKNTLTLLSISTYPYLFLPSIAILIKYLNIEDIYCLIVISSCIWVIRVRYKILNQYKETFSMSAGGLVILPFIIQLAISILLTIILGISIFSAIFNSISNINNLFYI